MKNKKKILFIIGRTCSGKDTLAKALGYPIVCSYATRAMRKSDIPDVTHHFISSHQAKLMVKEHEGDVLAYTEKGGATYFALARDLEAGINTYIINPDGLEWFREHGPKDIEYVVIYLFADNDVRRHRAELRGDNMATFMNREEAETEDYAKMEDTILDDFLGSHCHVALVSDDLSDSVEYVKDYLNQIGW